MKSKLLFLGMALATAVLPMVATAATLPDAAQSALLRALDDEYHAEAVYAATLDKFGNVRPFSNIIKAERKHQAALITLMNTYGVAVPENSWLSAAKPLPTLPDTLAEVCAIGFKAEIDNARLYDQDLLPAVAGFEDIVTVFKALSSASTNNHLPAFQRCAAGKGQQGN
jgi:hypothetical protein